MNGAGKVRIGGAKKNQNRLEADAWHFKMYDHAFASTTIGSKTFGELAVGEADSIIKLLGLKGGQRLLDVPCGTGRHAAIFGRRGIQVTGLDINPACLKLARKACRRLPVWLVRGDMVDLSLHRNQFDAVVNLFTSFGYFSTDASNEHVLKELVSTLKPGGYLLLHLVNRDWLLRVFKPVEWQERDGVLTLHGRRYDPLTKYNEAQVVTLDRRTGRGKSYFHRVRLYSKPEMVALLRKCGLEKLRVLGGLDGSRFKKFASSHPVYLARKPR